MQGLRFQVLAGQSQVLADNVTKPTDLFFGHKLVPLPHFARKGVLLKVPNDTAAWKARTHAADKVTTLHNTTEALPGRFACISKKQHTKQYFDATGTYDVVFANDHTNKIQIEYESILPCLLPYGSHLLLKFRPCAQQNIPNFSPELSYPFPTIHHSAVAGDNGELDSPLYMWATLSFAEDDRDPYNDSDHSIWVHVFRFYLMQGRAPTRFPIQTSVYRESWVVHISHIVDVPEMYADHSRPGYATVQQRLYPAVS
eukprot:3940736-Rhodomonas_salina.1